MMNLDHLVRADLNLFVLFQTVMEEGHVGRAAERLRLSPSAVSHGLRRLRRLLNDPLFLRQPKGVIATERAVQLAPAIADVLARANSVVASAVPFVAQRSQRRFVIGAPDAVAAAVLPQLLSAVRKLAPGIDIGLRQIRAPTPGETPWTGSFADLDTRAMDIALLPVNEVPARFEAQTLYEEVFVIAARAGHPFLRAPTLEAYCANRHLIVSYSGDAHGFVDRALERCGRARRVLLAVPNFMLALAMLAETDLLGAIPMSLAHAHAKRHGLAWVAPPVPLGRDLIRAVTPRPALTDAGLAWLLDTLQRVMAPAARGARRPRGRPHPTSPRNRPR